MTWHLIGVNLPLLRVPRPHLPFQTMRPPPRAVMLLASLCEGQEKDWLGAKGKWSPAPIMSAILHVTTHLVPHNQR